MDSGHRELVRSWLEKASHDLGTARRVIEREPPITDTAVYHCQQGLAKYADETGLMTDYIVVELARHRLSEG